MGIYGALATAVSGLRAQSFALENISGNIANSSTTAYKRTETSFADLVPDGEVDARRQVSGSVQAFSRSTNDVPGGITPSTSATAIAISGSGFMLVQDPTGTTNGVPTFGSDSLYTRRGDFTVDRNGYMVNGAGYYLTGLSLDPTTGAALSSTPGVVNITNDPLPAEGTSAITYKANLPEVPKTANYVAATPSSWLMDGGVAGTVTADGSAAFLASTIAGESLTVYNETGTSQEVQFRWGKVTNAAPGQPAAPPNPAVPATDDTWALFYQSDTTATGTEVAWTRVDADPATAGSQNYTFQGGSLTSPASGVTIPNMTVNGVNLGAIDIEHGTGLTQFADPNGVVSAREISQDGSAAGDYLGVEVTDGGTITSSYSNGKTRALYEIPVATFTAENQLLHLDGGAYKATAASGLPLIGDGAAIVGKALEESNVDVADEFTKLIVTQQAYSANTRIVSTSDEMLQEALRMIG